MSLKIVIAFFLLSNISFSSDVPYTEQAQTKSNQSPYFPAMDSNDLVSMLDSLSSPLQPTASNNTGQMVTTKSSIAYTQPTQETARRRYEKRFVAIKRLQKAQKKREEKK